jgi:hypothetical protein
VENNEQFLVFITSSDSDTRVVISTATVTILDDDCKWFLKFILFNRWVSFYGVKKY